MIVVGIDPAPSSGAHIFDGTGGPSQHFSIPKLEAELRRLRALASSLICWDAPLTGPADPDECSGTRGAFTKRSIETFFTQAKWGFRVPKGISVIAYSGCSHWTISRHFLGLPRVGPWDAKPASLPFALATEPTLSNRPEASRHYAVEVHPALAVWLWASSSDDPWRGPWVYKKDRKILDELWRRLCSLTQQSAPDLAEALAAPVKPADHNDFDARVAWLLGMLWIRNQKQVTLLGDLQKGSVLVPELRRLTEGFARFARQR